MQLSFHLLTLSEESTEHEAREALLDAAAAHGLVRAVTALGPEQPRGWGFQLLFDRKSEALTACDALNGSSLPVGAGSICKVSLPSPASCDVLLDTSHVPDDGALRRRFACCGKLLHISHDSAERTVLTFSSARAAALAVEDAASRSCLPDSVLACRAAGEQPNEKCAELPPPSSLAIAQELRSSPPPSKTPTPEASRPPSPSKLGLLNALDAAAPHSEGAAIVAAAAIVATAAIVAAADVPAGDGGGGAATADGDDKTKKKKRQHVSGDAYPDKPPAASAGGGIEDRQLFVVHSKTCEVAQVAALFTAREGFVSIDVKRNKRTGGVRGMAFVVFSARELAQVTVAELHGIEFPPDSKSTLKVMFACSSAKPLPAGLPAAATSSSSPASPSAALPGAPEFPHMFPYDYSFDFMQYQQYQQQQQQLMAEFELERELAARSTSTDVLADAFGSVMGFGDMYHPAAAAPYPSPHFVSMPGGNYLQPAGSYAQPAAYYHHHHLPPPPDTSRLHVVFSKTLSEHELYAAFQQAAPGLQYVSLHRDKPFAFAKFSTSASALLAMLRLNGTVLLGGVRLRVMLADPVANANMGARKRQRDGRASVATPVSNSEKETSEEE